MCLPLLCVSQWGALLLLLLLRYKIVILAFSLGYLKPVWASCAMKEGRDESAVKSTRKDCVKNKGKEKR